MLAATNRPDILDPALLRAGRFDRRVAVQPPDRGGRAKILKVHTRSMPLADDVDLDELAASTPGMVGADLANLANEAALLAAKREHDKVEMRDFTDSLEKLLLGAPRGILLQPADRERTAYHESGHALVGMLTEGADPVRKVSIIPRGMALGVTLSTPDTDRVSYSLEELEAKIEVSLGGRVAEEVVYGTITTGAESDIQQLTEIARQMVGKWGMSEAIGPVAVLLAGRAGAAAAGRERDLRAHPGADRRGDEEDRRGRPRRGDDACSPSTATSSSRSRRRCSRPRRSTRPRPTRPPACRCRRASKQERRGRGDARLSGRVRGARSALDADRADREAASADATIAVAVASRSRARQSPSEATAAGTPSCALAASAPTRAVRTTRVAISRIATFSTIRAPASPSIEGSENRPPRSRRAPSTTKYSGTKKPSATPRTCVESRFGPPRIATITPAPKPAMRMLVPLLCASQARKNRTSSDSRRSSAQWRCFERSRTPWIQPPELPRSITRAEREQRSPLPPRRGPCRARACAIRDRAEGRSGSTRSCSTSAIVTWAITGSATDPLDAGLLEGRQQHGGRARGEHDARRSPRASRRRRAAASSPAGTASTATIAGQQRARAQRRARAGGRAAAGACRPSSISIAKPTSARNDDRRRVSDRRRRSPCGPTSTPARISPTTTGTNQRRERASSGPARPARTITGESAEADHRSHHRDRAGGARAPGERSDIVAPGE